MISRKTLGRALFFGLGYLAGTRAGRERYAQIQAGAQAAVGTLRARLAVPGPAESGSGSSSSSSPSSSKTSKTSKDDPYGDIRLGH